jgi:hypothetical protein
VQPEKRVRSPDRAKQVRRLASQVARLGNPLNLEQARGTRRSSIIRIPRIRQRVKAGSGKATARPVLTREHGSKESGVRIGRAFILIMRRAAGVMDLTLTTLPIKGPGEDILTGVGSRENEITG